MSIEMTKPSATPVFFPKRQLKSSVFFPTKEERQRQPPPPDERYGFSAAKVAIKKSVENYHCYDYTSYTPEV